MSMSLDGYIAGPNDGPDNPGGDGFMRLHEWFATADGESARPDRPERCTTRWRNLGSAPIRRTERSSTSWPTPTSTPTGALTAVQKLVQQDNVFAIVEDSSDFFGAEPYALQQGIPVVGSAIDGPYWADPKDTNLFASVGVTNENYENAAQGQFMKSQGATKCASLGYSSSPSSALSAEGFIKSCEAAGLKSGYLNTQFPSPVTRRSPSRRRTWP